MTRLLPKDLQQKLLALILVTTFAALLVALVAMVTYALRNFQQGWISEMNTQAELLGRASAPALNFSDPKVATENLGLLRYKPMMRSAAIYDAHGGLFATYSSSKDEARFPKLPEADGISTDSRYITAFKRIVDNGEILGTVYLRAEHGFNERVLAYAEISGLVAMASMLVALFMSTRMQRIVTRPILAIAKVAREVVEQRDYSRRAEKLSNDEVGALVESFNDMLTEIEQRTRDIEASNRNLQLEIAERKRSELEVVRLNAELEDRVGERTEQLEVANRELEAFCFSVSHDLRGPLRAISGFSQALNEDFTDLLPEEGRRYLSRIQTSTVRMGQLIEDLLNLSRVSRGTIDHRATDISDLAREVVADLQQRQPEHKVDINVWDGMNANGDPRLLRAALENLIGNAWKFSSKTEKPHIEIGSLRDGGQTTFFVRDNGAGFDMAYADKLFGAFQRLHGMDDFPGTGIGLATVQRIVHRHGGRIWADAQVGKGAVFFFTLGIGRTEPAVAVPVGGNE